MSQAIRVAVVDDHPLYREGVVAVLKDSADFQVVGQGTCANDALCIVRHDYPDVLLLDIHLPGDGIAVAQKLSLSHPDVKIVMLTVSEREEDVSTALKGGAWGYIVKGVTGRDLVQIVREVHFGAHYVTPSLGARLLAQQVAAALGPSPNRFPELTCREGEIIRHVATGLTNKEVARQLQLSEKTVKHYMTSIMQKLQVRNRLEVALIASRRVEPGSGGSIIAKAER